VEETEMIFTVKYAKNAKPIGRAGSLLAIHRSPLPAARANANDGAHGLSRHSLATAEVTRPTEQQFSFRAVRVFRGFSISQNT
jgi:hypothetical protein